MRILVVNDDSVNAPQLIPLVKWCQKLGEVTVVVPKYEQSGKSQSIELHKSFEIKQVELEPGLTAYTVDSSPADCVRVAVLGMKKQFDLVVSGINRGFNMGCDIMYSGTAGGVFEAVSLGLKAVAISTSPEFYDRATEPLDQVLEFFKEHKLMELCDLYNVNVVPDPKGIRITRQGGHFYSDDFIHEGNDMYMPHGKCVYVNHNDLTLDSDCVMSGYISIMPMTINRADPAVYEKLKELNN
ncbi:MAG: 5'/3'-nucleotidase SurE [Oscillospiraceae bacterium]|nr:5'/3'-nucleotidase SurE [Oscillospiraceae bacterium]